MKKQILALAAGAALLVAAQNSFAGYVNATGGPLSYNVVLQAGCTAGVAGGGTLATKSAPYTPVTDALAGAVTVNCTNSTNYKVCVDDGLQGNGSTRRLADGASPVEHYLTYILSSATGTSTDVGDAGCKTLGGTSAPGDTATWAAPISGTGDTTDQTVNLYADVSIATTDVPGTYADTVVVSVVW